MPYCHATPDADCGICERYAADPEFAAVIDRVPPFKVPPPGKNGHAKPAKAETLPDCRFLGAPTGETVDCSEGCKRKIGLKVFACKVFGTTTIGKKGVGVAGLCKGCARKEVSEDRLPFAVEIPDGPRVHSNMDPAALARLIELPPPAAGWPKGWSEWPITLHVHRAAADAFVAAMPAYPEGRFHGRGITIATGGPYWCSTYVTVRMLRHVGCTLPIQCWYLGAKGERDERYEKLLEQFGVECIDIDTHPARKNRRMVAGFGTKFFAALNSPFEEVLSLDPDNYPCADPTVLFDDPRYLKSGAIYWPDVMHTERWTRWEFAGVVKSGAPCGLETGQYVLHKRLAWEPILLTGWYEDHADWCYGGGDGQSGMDYGDKGPPRVAWAKLGREYTVFNPVACHQDFAYLQPGPDGVTPMFVHRCHSKFTVGGEKFAHTNQTRPNARGDFPGEDAAFGYLEELKAAIKEVV